MDNIERIDSKDVTLKDLKLVELEGYTGSIHVIKFEIPRSHVERTEAGPLFAFNIREPSLFEFFLGVKRGQIIDFYDDKALLLVELGSEYLSINLSDLRKVKDAVLITQNT